MKKQNKFFKLVFIIVISIICRSGFGQTPTYELSAKNFTVTGGENAIEWDIYIMHTNPPAQFEYSGGQYFFAFNPEIANGGTLTYSIVGSDLPVSMRPRSPSIGTATAPSQTVLRLAINTFPGAGNGFIMTGNGFPGTKIVRMRLQTSASELNCEAMLGISWRNPPVVSFVTKIFVYIGTENSDITTPSTHSLDSSSGSMWGWCGPGITFHIYFDVEGMLNPSTNKFYRSDSIEVQSRSNVSPYNIKKTNKIFTDSGFITLRRDLFSLDYLVVKYRNAIETWSGSLIFFNPPYFYFTDSASSAYGSNQVLVGTRYCIYSGDVNQDGIIDGTDLSLTDNDAQQFTTGLYLPTDMNGDNIVDADDLAICDNNILKYITVRSPFSSSSFKQP